MGGFSFVQRTDVGSTYTMALDCTFLQRNFSRFRRARRSSSHPWFPAWGLRASGGRCFAKDHERMAVAVEEQANESAVSLLPSFLFVLSLLFTFESSVVDKVVFGMRLETKRKRRRLFLFAFLGCVQSSSISTATSSISRFRRLSSAVKVVQPCSDRKVVQVQNVSLTCDSPGAYYYGSNTYRDSTTCTQGDKAKLLVDCEFRKIMDLQVSASFNSCISRYFYSYGYESIQERVHLH